MKKKKEKQIDTTTIKSDDEVETFGEKNESQDYHWDKAGLTSPLIIPEESVGSGSLDQSPQFVQNTPHFYFNNPYQVNYNT